MVSSFLSALTVLASILVLNVHHQPAHSLPPPSLVRFITAIDSAVNCTCFSRCRRHTRSPTHLVQAPCNNNNHNHGQHGDTVSTIRNAVQQRYEVSEERSAGHATNTNDTAVITYPSWQRCAQVIDRFFFWLFFFANLGVMVSLFVVYPLAKTAAAL